MTPTITFRLGWVRSYLVRLGWVIRLPQFLGFECGSKLSILLHTRIGI